MAKRVRYYYDTEFLEDGKIIDLISIGMVSEDGREFYAVSNEFDTRRVAADNWLMDNVMSSIDHEKFVVADAQGFPVVRDIYVTDKNAMSRAEIRDGLLKFVEDTWPEFWAWYGAYDHIALCQLFGKMIDLPKGFPMFTMDLKHEQKRLKIQKEQMPVQPAGLHNALADARFNRDRHDFFVRYEKGRGIIK